MRRISQQRREWFGGLVFSENPACVLHVNDAYADRLGIPRAKNLQAGIFSAPLDVHIALTTRCNLHCRECYQPRGGVADMPLPQAQSILRHLASLKVFTVAFGGGEPFLHPDLFEIAEYARTVGIVPNITTRGGLISETNVERCQVFGNLHLSAHSLTDLSGLANTIRLLQSCGVHPGLNFLVSRLSFPELPDIVKACKTFRISRLLCLRFKRTAHNAGASQELSLTREQELGFYPALRKSARQFGIVPLIDCSFFPALAIHRPDRRMLETADVNGCQGGNAFISITADGYFKPCSFWPEDFGPVLELTPEIWKNHPELSAFRGSRKSNCRDCQLEELCCGGCRLDSNSEAICRIPSDPSRDTLLTSTFPGGSPLW